MSSQVTGAGTANEGEFGANEWLVEELYEQYSQDRNAVDKEWWPVLESYGAAQSSKDAAAAAATAATAAPAAAATAATAAPAAPRTTQTPQTTDTRPVTAPVPIIGNQPVARTTARPAAPQPIPAQAPKVEPSVGEASAENDVVTVLKGMTKALAVNMDESLTVPTATSVRTVPAKLMIDNRIVINNHMARTRGGKVSFTHLIGWALIQAIKEFPSQNVFYAEIDGKPSVVAPAHTNLGIAIDLPKPDGSRALLVPSI